MIVKINNSIIDYILPIQLSGTIDGGQDGGGFVFYDTSPHPLPQFSQCEITIGETTKYYYAYDRVEQKTASAKYKHTITLIDRLRVLEGYFMPNISFTQPPEGSTAARYTYASAINRVFDIVPLHTYNVGDDALFTFDMTLWGKLNAIEFPESFPTSKNLYEFVLNVGRALGAIPFMKTWKTVSFIFLEDDDNLIDDVAYSNLTIEKDISQYCTNIDTTISNLIGEGDGSSAAVVYPSDDTWTTRRTKDRTRITDEDSVVEVSYPIVKINKVTALADVVLQTSPDGLAMVDEDFLLELEIADYVLEESQYRPLADVDKEKRIYYTYGSRYLEGLYFSTKYWGIFPSAPAIKAIIQAELPLQYPDMMGAPAPGKYALKEIRTNNTGYRIEYVPFIQDMRAKIERRGENYRTPFSFNANQTDNMVNPIDFGSMHQQHIERIGKEYMTLVTSTDTLTIPEIGQSIIKNGKRYFLTSYNVLIGNKIDIETQWSEDFVAISEKIGLNALPRVQNIVARGNATIRSDVFTEHCLISLTDKTDSGIFGGKEITRDAFIGIFTPKDFEANNYELNVAFTSPDFYVTGPVNNYIMLSVNGVSLGNSLCFNISYPDNFSAGNTITNNEIKQVRYTNERGKINYLDINYMFRINGFTAADADKLPLISSARFSEANKAFTLPLWLLKDSGEITNITYQLAIETEERDIILGEMFTQKNLLINQEPVKYVLIGTTDRFNRNGTSWIASSSGAYKKSGDGYFKIVNSRRYNLVDGEYVQNASGTYLKVSRETRLVFCDDKLSINHKGIVPYQLISDEEITTFDCGLFNTIPTYPAGGGDTWAIVDETDKLIIGRNKRLIEKLYFNFKEKKDYENIL